MRCNTGSVNRRAQAGITLATGIMYLRILAIIAVFNFPLARALALPLGALSAAALAICALQYWGRKPANSDAPVSQMQISASGNPLELGAAAIFALLFVATSLASTWTTKEFGVTGIYSLAAIVGVSDIDPFVLNLAQGGLSELSNSALTAAILIAASSNNILKACYAASFAGGRATAASAAALAFLAAAGIATAIAIARLAG